MTKADLIDEVSKLSNLTKKETETIVNTIFDNITDALGGLEDAVNAAAKLANIPTPPAVERPRRRFSFLDLLRNELGLPVPGTLLRPGLPLFKTPLYLMD